jgi:DNA repair exonuclease SbcCD ATPase subunit
MMLPLADLGRYKMPKHKFSFETKVTPKQFQHITFSPIAVKFDVEVDLTPTDSGNIKAYQAAFGKEMTKAVSSQMKALDTLIKSWDDTVSGAIANIDKISKLPALTDPSAAKEREKILAREKKVVDLLNDPATTTEITDLVGKWVDAIGKQQGQVALVTAAKIARLEEYDSSNAKLTAQAIGKCTLVLFGAAVGIAAIVVTAGTATPLVLGLSIAGASLTGISTLKGVADTISANANQEKRTLENCKKDVEAIETALGQKGSAVTAHIKQLGNLVAVREDRVKKLEQEILKHTGAISGYDRDIQELSKLKPAEALVPGGAVQKLKKASADANKAVDALKGQIKAMKEANKQANDTLDKLKSLSVQIDDLLGTPTKGVLQSLKESAKEVDTWMGACDTVGNLLNAGGQIAGF